MRPLGITEQAWSKLMNRYNVDASLSDLAVSFGDKPRSSDAGLGAFTVRQKANGAYGITLSRAIWNCVSC